MSAPFHNVALKPAHGLSIVDVRKLRETQQYWIRIADGKAINETARDNAKREIEEIDRMLRHDASL